VCQLDEVIKLVGVKKSYNKVQVLRGVDLDVCKGSTIIIRGRSGAGKTTLIRIMGLLLKPDEGEVFLNGLRTSRMSLERLANVRLNNIGIVYQSFKLIPTLNVVENVELPLALLGMSKEERRKRALDALRSVGVEHLSERFPPTLSGGEKQRVAIARAIAVKPPVLLADEPTSQLDDETALEIAEVLRRLRSELGIAEVITTTELSRDIIRFDNSREYILKRGTLSPLST